jgi:hypothetical protein
MLRRPPHGPYLLAQEGFDDPTPAERRAAELVGMALAKDHPHQFGMMLECTGDELRLCGEACQLCGEEAGDRMVSDVPGLLRKMIEQTASGLREAA